MAKTPPQRSSLARHANSSTHRAAIEGQDFQSSDVMVLVNGKRVPLNLKFIGLLLESANVGVFPISNEVPSHEVFKRLLDKLSVQDYSATARSDTYAANSYIWTSSQRCLC